MLLFIGKSASKAIDKAVFQYISCYSLSILISERSQIKTGFNTSHVTLYLRYGAGLIPRCCFNTSHVTLYRKATKGWQRNNVVSIHLMLLFIVFKLLNKEKKQRFQYISCYSLSVHRIPQRFFPKAFQYISCYSLSKFFRLYPEAKDLFQYISCYSLSLSAILAILDLRVSIHLMLLFITEHLQNSNSGRHSFNTSHVTLYQFVENGSCKR